MRTNLIALAITAGINDTLAALFVARQALCQWQGGMNGCSDRPVSNCPVWGEFGRMPMPTRHGGECPNYDWTMSPRVCAGNLIQDEGVALDKWLTKRENILWCIQHQEFQLEFGTWGFPEAVQLYANYWGQGLWMADCDGLEGRGFQWNESFMLSKIQDEDAGPTKLPIRRGRMSHHGNEDRRASRVKFDNSWKRHRGTQWK
jgi:hypothetical protein